MSKIDALIIAPTIFPPTQLSFPVALEVSRRYKAAGITVHELLGPAAIRPGILYELNQQPELCCYFGHGNRFSFCGDDPFCKGITSLDAELFRDKIITALPACEVGAELGPKAVEHGAIAFVGAEEAMYGAFWEPEHDYYADWVDCILTFYDSLIVKTVGEAVNDYKNKVAQYVNLYKQNIGYWHSAEWYAETASINMKHLKVFGDANARLRANPLFDTIDKNAISAQRLLKAIFLGGVE